ncbi:hypothetical protein RAS1_25280 [Phycisphaerae bacterium RAS1]|nr:hypothetical protein RAS1_25280 [Phycisphaerae bacterium RAS1]
MSDVFSLGLMIMLAAIAAIGGLVIAARLRRWTSAEQKVEAFTMQEIREMLARGQISEQEFEAMRAALLGRRAPAAPVQPPAPPESPPPGST